MQEIILKSIYGTLNAEEQHRLDAWLSSKENARIYDEMKSYLEGKDDPIEMMASINVETALARVKGLYINRVC